MKASKLLAVSVGLLLAGQVQAQLNIPLSDVALAYPGLPPLTVQLGGTSRYILPTPFVLGGTFENSALWICMDPLQTIFYNGSGGQPAGAALNYQSQNPGLYDKWAPAAPGLDSVRLQHLADLFYAYAPTRADSLIGGALQLAVPEITNEFTGNTLSLGNGQFLAWGSGSAASVIALAETMLGRLDDADVAGKGNVKSLKFLIDGSYTNQNGTVFVQDLVGFTPVPEPSTYALAAIAMLVPIVILRVRRQRAAAAAAGN